MQRAITTLEIQLAIYENNVAINIDEGNWEQVKLEKAYIKSLKKAIDVLKAIESVKDSIVI